jgi:hypothetical protein
MKGEIILFKQKVYMSISSEVWVSQTVQTIGDRYVAGRVRESVNQFSKFVLLDVLWTHGVQPLQTMAPLKVKTHNIWRRELWPMPRKYVNLWLLLRATALACRALPTNVQSLIFAFAFHEASPPGVAA